ncbi:unnamed protein product, partial [Ectocarpus sp. 12 AP-2014]
QRRWRRPPRPRPRPLPGGGTKRPRPSRASKSLISRERTTTSRRFRIGFPGAGRRRRKSSCWPCTSGSAAPLATGSIGNENAGSRGGPTQRRRRSGRWFWRQLSYRP